MVKKNLSSTSLRLGKCKLASLKKALLTLARTSLGGFIIGWAFANLSFAIPVDRLRETESLLAFWHPTPAYDTHILIVPKRQYRSLLELPTEDVAFMQDLFEVVKSLVKELALEDRAYRLIVNGGDAQDVKQLHFHLMAEG